MTNTTRSSTTSSFVSYLLLLRLCLLLLATAPGSVAASSLRYEKYHLQSQSQQQQLPHKERQLAKGDDPSYALYSLPPFTIAFTSDYAPSGLPLEASERGQLLKQTLHSPLRLITGEFLMESFRIQIAANGPVKKTNNSTIQAVTTTSGGSLVSTSSVNLQNILDNLMTLDLQVAVRSMDASENDNGRRYLQSDANNNNNPNLLQFEADFFTTAAFLEGDRGANEPSNQEVAHLMGTWMDVAFVEDKQYYQDSLMNSETAVLQHMQSLDITTDSGAVFDPYTTGVVPLPPPTSPVVPPNPSSNHNNPNWSPSEKLFFTLLVMVSTLAIAGLIFALHNYRQRHLKKNRGAFPTDDLTLNGENYAPGGVDEYSDHTYGVHQGYHTRHSLSGRHADEIMEVLNASDRYLAQHRPDLFHAMQSASNSQHGGGVVPVAAQNSEDEEDDTNVPARRYVMATNPFSYLYGASYFHREREAVEEDQQQKRRRRRQNANNDPMDGVELEESHEEVPDDEDLDLPHDDERVNDHSVSGFLQNWFQQLVGTRTAARNMTQDGLVEEGDYYVDEDGLLVEEMQGTEVLACDEDPQSYEFAYQDFPRQDGTPCLIYEETLDEEAEEQFLRNSMSMSNKRDSLHSTTSYGVHDPLTDDEFRRSLSQQNVMEPWQNLSSSSFDRKDISIIQMQDDEIEFATDTTTEILNSSSDDSGDSPSQFTDKLERLVAMRHRHYEKQQIVEKHREQRRRQRAQDRQQQQEEMEKRDLLLRRHSLELDIQALEAAAGASSASSNTNVVSPNRKHQAQNSFDLQQLPKPNMHRRTSSEADMGVPPAGASAAAVVGIQTNRSMDLNEDRALDPTILESSSSLPMFNPRMVQSARKPPMSNSHAYADVFRRPAPVMASPMSASSRGSATGTKLENVAVVSPVSSVTDTGSTTAPSSTGEGSHSSRSTPPMGNGSIRDGSSARRKKKMRDLSSASIALAKGFHRRSMSFGGLEEKKADDDGSATENNSNHKENNGAHPLPRAPVHPQRSNSMRAHRRSNSSSPADVMVHGIYAQFV